MKKIVYSFMAVCIFLLCSNQIQAQVIKKEPKPYKLFSIGKQLRISSTQLIKDVMVWTTDGNRIVEQKKLNTNIVNIDIPVNRPYYFVMIGLANGKIYTEKVAL
jgi:hypothetical protein